MAVLGTVDRQAADALAQRGQIGALAANAGDELKLKEHSSRIFGRLAPIVALLHQAGQEAANHEAWSPIVEGGSFALIGWRKRYDIRDPVWAAFDLLAQEQDEQERDEKAETPEEETIDAEGTRSAWIRLRAYSRMAQRMLHDDVPGNARRLLLWLLHDLYLSRWADAVSVSRKFLPRGYWLHARRNAAGATFPL